AFRLNLMGNEGGVAGRDIAENRRFGIAPSLSLGLGSPTRWTFSYLHQTADDQPDYGIPWLFNGPAPVNRSNYYGFADGNYLRTYDDIGTAKVEHDFNDHITLRDQFRYANYVRDVLITEAQAPSSVQLNTPLSSIQVNRHEIGVNSVETNLDEQLDLMAHFRTGLLRHNFITGVEVGRETSDPTRPTYSNVPTTSLLNPNPYQPLSGTVAITSRVQTSAFSQAVYALDTISIGSKLDLSGGIRWDRFDTDYSQSVAPAAAFHRLDEKPTWRAAVTFKPVPIGSVYFDAGTSFNPSAESLSLSASTANLPPESNRTYEFGTKWNLGKLAVDSSWFRTEKTNAREPDPNNPTLNVLAGNQRVSGVQASVQGHITSRWEILAGYAYLDSRLVSSNYYPRAIGGRLANVPANTFNIWSSYRLPAHWNLGAGGNFVSSRTASSTAPFDPITGLVKEVPGYWVFNAMLSHPLAEHIDLQVNAYNLANRYYYDELHPAHIVLGPGRSVLAALKFHF
ncbi:MAG TPA: TonB-dependent receptor, partial [Bryobacteraceae bacterium]|nr:TonB-dependent receptor [Bryobacteraceae bacterium]